MIGQILFLIIFFYILILLETSFLIYFDVFRIIPNLILIALVLLVFLEKPKDNLSIFGAIIGGFFWDIFSPKPIGFYILILLGLVILLKIISKKYVRLSFQI